MKGTTNGERTPSSRCDAAAEPETASPRRLPVVRIRGRLYYRDDRLEEFRAIDSPGERVPFEVMAWAMVILGKWPD